MRKPASSASKGYPYQAGSKYHKWCPPKGVEGFGDLEQHIGKQIEVYANKLENGDYTPYGDANYFIELKK